MEQFCDNLRCCSNLISGFELQTTCPLCGRGASAKPSRVQKRALAPVSGAANSAAASCRSDTPDSTATTGDVVAGNRGEYSTKRRRLKYGKCCSTEKVQIL